MVTGDILKTGGCLSVVSVAIVLGDLSGKVTFDPATGLI